MSDRARTPLFDEKSAVLDRFGIVLVMTIASLVLLSLVDLRQAPGSAQNPLVILANAFVSIALLFALRASGLARRWQRLADILVTIGFLSTTVLVIAFLSVPELRVLDESGSWPPYLALVLSILAPLVVVRRLLRHRVVGRGTLMGAIAVYLLIPVAFFYTFITVDLLATDPFFGDVRATTDFMYFSLSTVTTVGYGDLTAAAPTGRMFANAESLIGQLYLVTFIGLLVGLLTNKASASRDSSASQG